METDDNSINKEEYYNDDYIPEELEELLEACKYNPNFLELLQLSFIDPLEEYEDIVNKANDYLNLAMLGHQKLPSDLLLNLTYKAIKTFPRVKMGMQYLMELCAESYYNDNNEDGYNLRFAERHTTLFMSILVLSNCSSEKIKNILTIRSEPTRDEQQVIDDLEKICEPLDNLFNTWDADNDKKVLYEILYTRIEPRYAAVLTITIKNLIPHPVIRAFYYINGSETILNQLEKDEEAGEFLKYYDLLAENERLKQEIEKVKREKKEALKKQGKPPLTNFGVN